jgi:hypothetical protein
LQVTGQAKAAGSRQSDDKSKGIAAAHGEARNFPLTARSDSLVASDMHQPLAETVLGGRDSRPNPTEPQRNNSPREQIAASAGADPASGLIASDNRSETMPDRQSEMKIRPETEAPANPPAEFSKRTRRTLSPRADMHTREAEPRSFSKPAGDASVAKHNDAEADAGLPPTDGQPGTAAQQSAVVGELWLDTSSLANWLQENLSGEMRRATRATGRPEAILGDL